ncbi:MAG: transposase zinc-binding domain-containing protein [Coprococcus phoceensis]
MSAPIVAILNLSLSVVTDCFCPTCGNKYAMERTTNMSFKLVNVAHRHCVFTIDENLRDFFLYDRSLLNCLFHAVNSVISTYVFQT